MVQLVELPAVVGLYYDGVKILLSPGDRDRGFDSFKGYIFSLESYLNIIYKPR